MKMEYKGIVCWYKLQSLWCVSALEWKWTLRYSKRNCILRVGRDKNRDDVYKSSGIVYHLKCYNESYIMMFFFVISYNTDNNMDIYEIIILRTIYCTNMSIFYYNVLSLLLLLIYWFVVYIIIEMTSLSFYQPIRF